MMNNIILPAEWHKQEAIQIAWPHSETDWVDVLEQVNECYRNVAIEILKRQRLIVVCRNAQIIKYELRDLGDLLNNLTLIELPTNDTWARDFGGISVLENGKKQVYDFTFNAWGLKFAANHDNQITRGMYHKGIFADDVELVNKKSFVLEGGAIESDGKGTLLTTSECLLSPNRNSHLKKQEIEDYLKDVFGVNRVLWLDHGYLVGDDTDSHIDTLARFCDEHTIAYVKCEDENDEHYGALKVMEEQLERFVDFEGNPYKLIPLPMASLARDENAKRLPATYANFLIMNDAVLLPIYNDKVKDTLAIEQLQKAFPEKEIVGIDCSVLVRQHGSLHCITMQYPEGFIK